SRRIWLTLDGDRPYRCATSSVRSPTINSSATRRSRSHNDASHSGKSMRKAACSSGGVCVLSCNASASGLVEHGEWSGSLTTVKSYWRWASEERTSFAFSCPQSRRPEFTARAAKVARAETNRVGSFPRRKRRRNHFQHSATISATHSSFALAFFQRK